MFRHLSKGLILSLLACTATPLGASVVSVEDAKQLAAEFLRAGTNDDLAMEDALDLAYTAGTKNHPYYYVFNARSGKGYVIVSADDTTAPVLGYSTEGSYNAATAPAAMQWMLSGLASEIKAAPSLSGRYTASQRRNMVRRTAAVRTGERILLETAKWSQESPFNASIPGGRLVGCVGTAMSIIMKYHEWPAHGTGSFNGVSYDVDYDWANMRTDNYHYGYSAEEAAAVSTLMYHAASSIDTQFAMSGSSAYEVRVPGALTNYFGYDPGVTYRKRSEFSSQAAFDAIVIEEIRQNRPVLYCGQDVTVGHAFVVDGYDPATGMLHINWGWAGADGNFNGGWYASTALNPTVSQSHQFNNLTTIIYNIKPGSGSNSNWSPLHLTSEGGQVGIGSDMTQLAVGKKFTVRAGAIKNVGYDTFSGKIAVALFSAAGEFKSLLSGEQNITLQSVNLRNYIDFYNCELPAGVEIESGDMVRIATSQAGGNWLPVPGELLTVNELPADRSVIETFAVNFPPAIAGISWNGESSVIKGWNYSFSITPGDPEEDVLTVKANGILLTPATNTYNYSIANVREDQEISILLQKASEVKAKRNIWVDEPGTLSTIISSAETGTITELTLFGQIDARDFEFMRNEMNLTRLDISGVYIAAYGSDQANAVPRNAFADETSLKEVVLPNNINRINNAAFSGSGIVTVTIPAGVSTYEYNIFLNCDALRDVWVGREKAEFINWCVFAGARTDLITLHVPNQNAVSNYSSKENWKDIRNIIVDPIPAQTDFAFAVMEDAEVKFDSKTVDGRYPSGTVVNFTAEHIADNDNRMAVYANSTLLSPDAEGVYTVTMTGNTMVHFDLVKPTPVASYASPWQLTDTGGTVGLLTDAVNVIPGVAFTIRANAFYVPSDATSMFWAAVLTDAEGNIKEFISPVSTWVGAQGDGLKMNVNCCVKESTVREGNLIRLATSYNMKTWALVGGKNENVVDRLAAINNQTPVYYFTYPENLAEVANVSGNVVSAVRGRDITLKVTPKNASYMMDAVVNGDTIVKGGKTFSYSFIAKEDIDFDIKVYPPVTLKEATIVLAEGQHLYYSGYEGVSGWGPANYQTSQKYKDVEKLKIVGKLDYYDFDFFRSSNSKDGIAVNLKYLDLSEATLVRDRDCTDPHAVDNYLPSYAFQNDNTGKSALEEIILPESLTQFNDYAFAGCTKLREIHLPAGLRNWSRGYTPSITGSFGDKTIGGLNDYVFDDCSSLETIYLPCVPGEGGKVGHWYYSQYHSLKTGLPDNSKVTVVVLPEYLDVYKTPHVDTGWYDENWSNGWEAGGFNLVGEYPVYSLNFDASRLFVADKDFDVEKAASFLRDNISLESINVDGKLFVGALSQVEGRPEGVDTYRENVNIRLYDNGRLIPAESIGADGSVNVTFWNPNSHSDKSGNHEIKAIYLYDVLFNCASDQFTVTPEIRNNEDEMGDEATEFEVLDLTEASTPVLRNVPEDSSVRFAIGFSTDNQDIRPRVKVGDQVLTADEEGYYTVNVEDADVTVEIYAIPSNGATLTTEEIVSVNPSESADVTTLSLQGEIDEETLAIVVNGFESLSTLDLSGMESEIPANAFEGKTTLTEVILPEVDTILPGTFKDCENLATVTVPETVSTIGSEAFSGCASLEQITLTGIDAIGADAFAGCDNLTSITLNPATGSPVAERAIRCRAPRMSGFDENAFNGVNPNCLIILGEGVGVPAAVAGNYLASRVEEMPVAEDVAVTRPVRVYESAGDINLRAGYPFATENAFTMNGDDTISLVTEVPAAVDGWKSLVVPFAVATVAADGQELVAKTAPDQDSAMTDYMVAALVEGDKEIALTAGIAPNVPALIRQTKSEAAREITLSASGVTVEATPATVKTEGSEYSLCSSYRAASLPSSTTYVLNAEGNAFEAIEPAEGEEELAEALTEVAPFEVYAVAPAGEDRIVIAVAGDDIITSVDMLGAEGFKVVAEGSDLVIWTAEEMDTAVYALDGRMIGRITLNPGRNVISGLTGGVYIVEGIKVIL